MDGVIRSSGPSEIKIFGSAGAAFVSDSSFGISSGRMDLVQLSGKSNCFLCNANFTSNLNLFDVSGKLTTGTPEFCKSTTIAGDLRLELGSRPILIENIVAGRMFWVSERSGPVQVNSSSIDFVQINSTRNGDISLDKVSVTDRAFITVMKAPSR